MSGVKYFNYNLVTQSSTVITAGNENSLFPASNIADPRSTKVFRTETGTLTTEIVFDFQTTESVDSVLIKGHHLDGLGTTGAIVVEANATDEWTSPSFSTSFTPDATFNFGYVGFATQSYRYWRITATASSGYLEIGKLFIGAMIELTNNNIDYGWTIEEKDLSKVSKNTYGQKFVDVKTTQKMLKAQLKLLNKSELDTMLTMFDTNGISEPVWVIVDSDENIVNDYERFSMYGYFDKNPVIKNDAFSLYSMSLSISEAT